MMVKKLITIIKNLLTKILSSQIEINYYYTNIDIKGEKKNDIKFNIKIIILKGCDHNTAKYLKKRKIFQKKNKKKNDIKR